MDLITLALVKKLIESNNTIEYYDSYESLPQPGVEKRLYKAGSALYEWNGAEYIALTVDADVLATLEEQIKLLKLPLGRGEAQSSIFLRQPGSFNSRGQSYSESTANEPGVVSLGGNNHGWGANGILAGHDNETYQYDASALGAGNIVGDKDKWFLFKDVLYSDLLGEMSSAAGVDEEGLIARIAWMSVDDTDDNDSSNWNTFRVAWNAQDERQIQQTRWANFNHIHKASFAFASGTSNIVTGRAAFASGTYLLVTTENKAAFGAYNVDNGTRTILEVGMGTSESTRANAFEVYKDGSAKVATQGLDQQHVLTVGYANNTYVKKINNSSGWMFALYGLDSNNSPTLYRGTYGVLTGSYSIVARDLNGRFQSASIDLTDSSNGNLNNVVNGNTLLGALQSYLPKDNSSSGYSYRFYAVRAGGAQEMIRATNGVAASCVAIRDANGACQFADPTYQQDAATKHYVDAIVGDIETALDEIIIKQEEMM